ncbi:hypothetical protein JXO59_07900, partial [candidate division KSB1 bacterium]|nr:hypothetical protein [candidate division KSB1 bacterium]
SVGFETRHARDFKEKVKIGAEYCYSERYILRMGYMGNYDERGLTFGFGLRMPELNNKYRIDYGFQDFGLLGSTHIVTFGIGM